EGVRVARFCLPGHRVTELLIGVAVGGIEVVAVEAIRPLHDVAIEVNHRMTVPAHRRPLPREGTQASWASSDRTPSLFRSAARFCQPALVLTITPRRPTRRAMRGSSGAGAGEGWEAAMEAIQLTSTSTTFATRAVQRRVTLPEPWSRGRELNPRPTDYESVALPLSYPGVSRTYATATPS